MEHSKKTWLPSKTLILASAMVSVSAIQHTASTSLSRLQEMQQQARQEKIESILEPYKDQVDMDAYKTVLQAQTDRIRLAKGLKPLPKKEIRSPLSTKTDTTQKSVEQIYSSKLLPIITSEAQWRDKTQEGIFNSKGDSVHFEYAWNSLPQKDSLMLNRINDFQKELTKAIHKYFPTKEKRDYLQSSNFAAYDHYSKSLFTRLDSIAEHLKNRINYYNKSIVNPTLTQKSLKQQFKTAHATLKKFAKTYFDYDIPDLKQ